MAWVSSWKGILLSQAGPMALVLANLAPTITRAQEVVPSTPSASVPAPAARPDVVPMPGDDSGQPQPAVRAVTGPPADVQAARARVVMGPMDVIAESIFGEASVDDWQPLSLLTFFSEGWDQPYVRSPQGTNGAPKQNWFGAVDAVFVRANSLNLFDTNGMTTHTGLLLTPLPWSPAKPKTNGNEYWASYNLYLPLNQRMELLVVVPFIASNKTSATGHYVGNFGDLTFSERFRLIEQRNFTMQALLTERTPTGQTVNGNDINFITPSVEAWWNFAPRWVVRGGTGINIDTGRRSATSTYFNNMAIGRYLTDKDARVFKDLVVHLAVSTVSDVLGRKDYITDVYVSPGIRCGLDRDQKWYMLAAAQFPVSGPHPYAWQPMFSLVRNY
jgi:hypothetical protein